MQVSMRSRGTRGGLEVTALGLGCAAFGGLYRDAPVSDARADLQAAWDRGIRYFDVAPMYGLGRADTSLAIFCARLQALPLRRWSAQRQAA